MRTPAPHEVVGHIELLAAERGLAEIEAQAVLGAIRVSLHEGRQPFKGWLAVIKMPRRGKFEIIARPTGFILDNNMKFTNLDDVFEEIASR